MLEVNSIVSCGCGTMGYTHMLVYLYVLYNIYSHFMFYACFILSFHPEIDYRLPYAAII